MKYEGLQYDNSVNAAVIALRVSMFRIAENEVALWTVSPTDESCSMTKTTYPHPAGDYKRFELEAYGPRYDQEGYLGHRISFSGSGSLLSVCEISVDITQAMATVGQVITEQDQEFRERLSYYLQYGAREYPLR